MAKQVTAFRLPLAMIQCLGELAKADSFMQEGKVKNRTDWLVHSFVNYLKTNMRGLVPEKKLKAAHTYDQICELYLDESKKARKAK